jgi:hypothetical protein
MTMREEFELWFGSKVNSLVLAGESCAARGLTRQHNCLLEAWEASRAALVVVIPPAPDDYRATAIMREACAGLIEAAGLKVRL